MTDPKSHINQGSSEPILRNHRLRDLSPEDRPRERLLREGPRRLDHASLLSLLLGTGCNVDEDALMLARRLLKSLGSLHTLSQSTADTLCAVRGVGPAKAARLIAAFELSRRVFTHDESLIDELDHSHIYVSLTAILATLARDRWDGEGSLVIACPTPKDLSVSAVHDVLDSAVTLSLGGDLRDTELYKRWFARLLVEGCDHSWCLISLRLMDELHPDEQAHLSQLIAGAELLQLDVHCIIASSLDRHWTLLESSQDDSKFGESRHLMSPIRKTRR